MGIDECQLMKLFVLAVSFAFTTGKSYEQYFTIPEGSPARLECYR